MPTHLSRIQSRFRALTGLSTATSIKSRPDEGMDELPPPLHPTCASLLRSVKTPPCRKHWRHHIRSSIDSRRNHGHVCPLGLRCACVPIYFEDTPIGVAKLVTDTQLASDHFTALTETLSILVSLVCCKLQASLLRDELRVWTRRFSPHDAQTGGPTAGSAENRDSVLVDRALDYIHRHYNSHDLCLLEVSAAVGCNPRYLTTLFTKVVGRRMRAYLVRLRVEHACHQLMDADSQVKRVAYNCGFKDPRSLARAFRKDLGVGPKEYQRLFTA